LKEISIKTRITTIYFLFGVAWILLSDEILFYFIKDVEQLTKIQSFKGWTFIVVTSILLYFLVKEYENEKNESEKKLSESKEYYISLLEQAPYAIEVYNKEGFQTYFNKEYTKFWDIKTTNKNRLTVNNNKIFTQLGLLEFINKSFNGEIIDIPTYSYSLSSNSTNLNSQEKLVKTQIYPIKNSMGDVEDIVISYIDVSAEKNVKKFENILSLVFETLPDILFIIKKDGTIVDYRSKTNEDLYLQPEFFINKKVQEILPEDAAKLFEEYLPKTIKKRDILIYDYELEVGNERRYYESRMSLLGDDEHLMALVRDITEDVKSKEQLEFQSLLLEQSIAATSVLDDDGKFCYVNESYLKLWGYENENEILGNFPSSHYYDSTIHEKIISELEKDKNNIFTLVAKKKDGSLFNILMGAKLINIKNKKFYISSSIDISKRVEISKQYETIFNNVREGVFITEIDGTIINANPYIERLFDKTKSELVNSNIKTFLKTKDLKKLKRIFHTLISKKEAQFEIDLISNEGNIFTVSINSQIINFENKQIIYGTLKDLSQENENMFLLERSKRIFENLKEGVIITDANGYITETNKAFSDITGYSYHDVLAKKISIIKSDKYNEDFYNKLFLDLKQTGKWSGKIINKRKNEEEFSSFLTLSAIKDNKGELQNYIGIFADISDILNYEKELRKKDLMLSQQSKMAMMGEMIGNIAHQWKQPLSAISMSNGMFMLNQEVEGMVTKDELDKSIKNISNSVEYMSHTIDDFKNFFKPEKNKKYFKTKKIFEKTYTLMEAQLKNNSIEIIKNIEDIELNTFENELLQVLVNILKNARDALVSQDTKNKKLIFVDIYKKDKKVYIQIKDSAGGIAQDIKGKIFDAYFTTKDESDGTGIGLYMTKQIIEGMNGEISVSNEEFTYENIDYKGALFTVKLANVLNDK